MLERQLKLHRFSGALDVKRERVARERPGRDQIREFDLAVERIDVISVRVDLVVADAENNVANFQPRFRGRRTWIDAGHIHARRFAGLLSEFPQLRIARGKESKTGCGKTFVRFLLGVFQKVGDDRRWNGIDHLGALIVSQEERGEFVVLNQRHRVAVVAILQRHVHAISEELPDVGGITRHLDGGDETFGQDERPGRFQLERSQSIAASAPAA